MFSLRIERNEITLADGGAMEDGGDAGAADDEDLSSASIRFTAGNPRVEHITGIVHLYRDNNSVQQQRATPDHVTTATASPSSATKGAPGQPTFAQAVSGVVPERTSAPTSSSVPLGFTPVDTLCCLAIPADMSVAEFCTFCGAYLMHIREMRVLRREAAARVVCMVLVRFDAPEHAQSFYDDFNNKPFCSLEPEILCRLVHVKSVELLDSRPDRTATKVSPTAAATTASICTAPIGASTSGATSGTTSGTGARGVKGGSAMSSRGGSGGGGTCEIQPVATEAAGGPEAGSSGAGGSKAASDSQRKGRLQVQQPGQPPLPPLPSPSSSSALAALSSPAFSPSFGALPPPVGSTELPSCPVCLERLDYHISGVVTTVCNHQFHSECLQKWGDTSCPVCRYCSQPGGMHASRCSVCSSSNDLWICLICGHIGCGRYKAGHASDHWEATQHCYALELETQRVWDYAGDNYVHRLIQSKTDGKLVEVPSPAPSAATTRGGIYGGRPSRSNCGAGASQGYGALRGSNEEDEGGYFGPEDEGLKEALVASKLDVLAQEYNHLITTQLDSQRQYFEGLLSAAAKDAEARVAAAELTAAASKREAAEALVHAKEADKRRQVSDKKLAEVSSSLQQVNKENDFLRSLNETLLTNQQDYQQQLSATKADLAAKDAENKDLQEQVRDLMVFIEAQRIVASSGGDLHEATVLPVPASQRNRAGAGRQSKGKQAGSSK